jgi:uncharacterized protein YjiS (DUF1127 family)
MLNRLFDRFADYRRRRRTALALAALGERELKDLGISRYDVEPSLYPTRSWRAL